MHSVHSTYSVWTKTYKCCIGAIINVILTSFVYNIWIMGRICTLCWNYTIKYSNPVMNECTEVQALGVSVAECTCTSWKEMADLQSSYTMPEQQNSGSTTEQFQRKFHKISPLYGAYTKSHRDKTDRKVLYFSIHYFLLTAVTWPFREYFNALTDRQNWLRNPPH